MLALNIQGCVIKLLKLRLNFGVQTLPVGIERFRALPLCGKLSLTLAMDRLTTEDFQQVLGGCSHRVRSQDIEAIGIADGRPVDLLCVHSFQGGEKLVNRTGDIAPEEHELAP